MRPQIPEALLARLWQERAARQGSFKTSEGRHIQILYPGRRGSEAGPDFRDVLMHWDGLGLVRGDVELHLRQGDWHSHGHGADPRYNGVVLHGVLDGSGGRTRLQSGSEAPVVCLQSLLNALPSSNLKTSRQRPLLWSILETQGYPEPRNRSQAQKLLDRAGQARFLRKSIAFLVLMKEEEAQEVLYQAVMECLGYSENRDAFMELARLMPYRALKDVARKAVPGERLRLIEEALLKTAGFQSDGAEVLVQSQGVHPGRWRLFRVRPSNHPRRRIAGAARLLDRFLDAGLLKGLTGTVQDGSFKRLERDLTVSSPGHGPSLIGKSRAADIAVNAVLPFIHAWSLHSGNRPLAALAHDLFRQGPRLQPNRLTREMEMVLFPPEWLPLADSVPRQQGLIHFHHLAQGES